MVILLAVTVVVVLPTAVLVAIADGGIGSDSGNAGDSPAVECM